jgi:hemoglobin/transferrin/lactoferrin receptor protein
MNKRFFILSSSLFVFFSSTAQQDTTAKLLDSLVLTSQRMAQKQHLIPYSVHVLGQNDLKDFGTRSTPEALSLVNGVFIQKTNHGGGSPFLRGLTGNQALILVDGIRLNNSIFRYGPNQYLNTIDPYSIQKIEVAKGTGSVQYGTDAIGGVIQVFTKDPSFSNAKPQWHGRALSKYMSGNMEKTLRGEAAYSAQKFAAHVGATYRNFGDLIGGDTTGKQSPSGYKELAFDVKTKFLLRPNLQLTLAHQLLQQQDVPVYHKVVLENYALNEMNPQRRSLIYAKLNWSTAQKLFKDINVIASLQNSLEQRNSRKNNSAEVRKEEDKVNTLGLTLDFFSQLQPWWTANSGIELYHDKVNSTREDINTQASSKAVKRGLYPDDATYGNYSLFTLHHFQWKKLNIEAGLRYNTFSIGLTDTSLGKVNITPSSLVYNAAVQYRLTGQHNLYAAWNTGYRAPNVDDMGTLGIVDFRYEVPASDLKPERSNQVEVGYKLHSKKVAATVAAYYMHLENLVTRVKVDGQVINGYQVYKKENVEKAYIKGAEAEVNWHIFKNLLVRSALSYTYGQSLTKDEPMRRIPPFNGSTMVKYKDQNWFGAIELFYASKQDRLAQGDKDDNRIPMGGTPGWEVINLYAGYQLNHLNLNLGLQNLLNKDYRTHGSGINGVGRSVWLSASIDL